MNYKAHETESFNTYLSRLYPNEPETHEATFQVTEDCCLRCSYCYQHLKTPNKLSFTTAKNYIDDLLNDKYDYLNSSTSKGIIWDFIGGEPFLEIELIEQIVEYIYDSMIIMNHPWLYYSVVNICSNGILYNTQKVQHYFQNFGHLTHLGISIDGNQELHDSCRKDINGNGSYERAINAVKLYRQQFHTEAPTKMTLAPSNIQYLYDAVINLIKEDYKEIHLNCAYEPGWTKDHGHIMYFQLKKITDYLLDNNLYNKIFISLFEEDMFIPIDIKNNNKNWCGGTADGGNLALDYNGKLYPCIRYMNNSLNGIQEPLWIGEIKQGIGKTEQTQFNLKKLSSITKLSQSSEECLSCPIAEGCGWCSAYNYEVTGDPNKRVTYICIMHKARALANIYYWNKLYQKLNLPKIKKNYVSKKDAIQIIGEEEYNNLINLILKEGE